ncbi:MAG: hypothetical protein ACE5PM_03775 [Candidatus Hydrothermarchaeales archaeon]
MKKDILWHWLVFSAALIALVTLVVGLIYELTTTQEKIMEILFVSILIIFAVDLIREYRRFKGSPIPFAKHHWLDILAIIPIFRIFRIVRLARAGDIAKVEELGRLEKAPKVRRGAEAEETFSKGVHSKHLEEGKEEED